MMKQAKKLTEKSLMRREETTRKAKQREGQKE